MEIRKTRLGFLGLFVLFAVLGLDNSVASHSDENHEYLNKEIDAQWELLDAAGKPLFHKRINKRLSIYEEIFKKASNDLNIQWTLLAAISYQESHWNPKAISKTGVRGLMMLTQQTAKEMGVSIRTDPIQSIIGGSSYYQKIFNRLPDSIPSRDKVWMSLAAYNIGFGHLMDARALTKKQNRNVDNWEEVKKSLRLLTKKEYYKDTKFGYVKGGEAVQYADKVSLYYRTLALWEREKKFFPNDS